MKKSKTYKKLRYLYCALVVLVITGTINNLQSSQNDKSTSVKGAHRMVQIPDNMDEILDSALAEKFDFASWREAVSGPVVRFHRNFELKEFDSTWELDGMEIEPGENEFVLQNSDYQYVKKGNDQQQVIIRIVECESIRIAHQMIFSSLKNVTHPEPPLDRPKGYDFGDVYKFGYWARDNCFIYVNDISEPSLGENEIKKINEAIDLQLTHIPDQASDKNKERPEITKFTINVKTIPVNSTATIDFAVKDPHKSEDTLQYICSAEGGQIFMKNNTYFYKADKIGSHKLGIAVTNSKGLTARQELTVKVVQ